MCVVVLLLDTLYLYNSGVSSSSLPGSIGGLSGLRALYFSGHHFQYANMLPWKWTLESYPTEHKLLWCTMTQNRARLRTAVLSNHDGNGGLLHTPFKLWPLVLCNATPYFARDGFDRSNQILPEPDAIYLLLNAHKESFIRVLIGN